MSQPVSRLLHPFDATRRPSFEPEVRRAILARLADDSKFGNRCIRNGGGRAPGR